MVRFGPWLVERNLLRRRPCCFGAFSSPHFPNPMPLSLKLPINFRSTLVATLFILQSPSSLGTPGVTGGVRWDSGVVLGKFLEHSVDSGMLVFQGNNIVELGSGCGWVGYIAGLLDGEVIVFLYGFLLGSDVVYSEGDVLDLLETLVQLSGPNTTIFLAGELRNDAILEYFLEAATDNFTIGRLDQKLWHPDNCSNRVVRYVLLKK
ncbi:hypothetical protein D0Y65_024348 [Glycine soja]|uniref:Protein N-lysine methyltransferase METTL21A n=1 Tax=Glycine soja TaxID=3848 RepID=A0A445J1S8_GLYSO|nr:hypothetical protein D0Y65_024348 [Glycine soja]